MVEKVLLIDVDRCVGCYSCEVACKQENGLDLPSRWCLVTQVGPRKTRTGMSMDFVTGVCLQCDRPLCADVCPAGAITRREDGIVTIGEEKCNGCGLCVHGCPYGAIYVDQERGVAGKCSLCAERIDHSLEPSCVQHCISGALQYIPRKEVEEITRGMHTAGTGKVWYTSSKWKLALRTL